MKWKLIYISRYTFVFRNAINNMKGKHSSNLHQSLPHTQASKRTNSQNQT